MELLSLRDTGNTLGKERAARVRKDVGHIGAALANADTTRLAEAVLNVAADVLARPNQEEHGSPEISPNDREALASFGAPLSAPVSRVELLTSSPYRAGIEGYAKMVAEARPLAEAAKHLGVDPSRLRQRIKQGSLLAIKRPRGRGWLVPAFQLTDDGELPHLSEILKYPRTKPSALSVQMALTSPQDETMGLPPREWLISGGDPAPVTVVMAGL